MKSDFDLSWDTLDYLTLKRRKREAKKKERGNASSSFHKRMTRRTNIFRSPRSRFYPNP